MERTHELAGRAKARHGPNLSRLAVRAATLLLLLAAVQALASLLFYNAIDRETLREDHARRVAELLVVSDRVHDLESF